MEANHEVELREVLGPSGLTVSQNLGSGEVFKVFVIGDDVNGSTGAFKIVLPDMEGFKDSQEFFSVDVPEH